ncbi:MAG: hypothetical protein HZB25_09885 [Candidatus Eisenbacteria bacterium]|nr:hypothetical protein [Candidatus Eisenbacteria bacterium]
MNLLRLPRGALALWVVALGAGALAVASPSVAAPAVLAVWVVAFAMGEVFWLPTYGRRGTISTAMMPHLAAVALLPAGQAVAPAVCVALLADLAMQRKPAVKALYNAALLAITLRAAGWAWAAGVAAVPHAGVMTAALGLACAALAYWSVNRAGVVAIISLAEGVSPWRAWRENFGFLYEALVHGVEVVVTGILLAAWPRVGVAGLAALALVCFFCNDAYRRRNRLERLRVSPRAGRSSGRARAA